MFLQSPAPEVIIKNQLPVPTDSGLVSTLNSTEAPLGISAVYTGTFEDVSQYSMLTVCFYTDQDSANEGLQLQFSTDGTNIDRQKTVDVLATGGTHTLAIISKYFRVVYTNGAVAQTAFRFQTIYHKYKNKALTSTAKQVISDRDDVQLMRTTNDPKLDMNRNIISDKYTVHKFGDSPAITTGGDDIWFPAGAYNWLTSASVLNVRAGGNVNDDSAGTGARTIRLEGLDANWEPITEDVTLAGASASSNTSATFIRLLRAYVLTCGTYTSNNTGDILIEAGSTLVGDIEAGIGQTQMTMYSVRAGYTGYLTRISTNVDSSKTCSITMFRRDNGDTVASPFSPKRIVIKYDGLTRLGDQVFDSYISFPEKTDLWFYGLSGTGTVAVDVNYDLIMVKN